MWFRAHLDKKLSFIHRQISQVLGKDLNKATCNWFLKTHRNFVNKQEKDRKSKQQQQQWTTDNRQRTQAGRSGNWSSYHALMHQKIHYNHRTARMACFFYKMRYHYCKMYPPDWSKSGMGGNCLHWWWIINWLKTSCRTFSEMKYEYTLMTQIFSKEYVLETSQSHQEGYPERIITTLSKYHKSGSS